MWYTDNYRRNLIDMHIEDWNEEFLSKFSPDEYVKCMKLGKISSPMIYLQSHVGHCYFPTKTGHMHSAFIGREDMIKQTIDKCRAEGMATVGYYSLIYNTYEEDRHPEWKIHDGSGQSRRDNNARHGLCCPNNMKYREFVFAQIKEISEYFTLDGMFYDMLFWPQICRCDSCKTRYNAEAGGEIPADVDWNDKRWVEFSNMRSMWMGEFAMSVTKYTKSLMPHVSVEHNYASAVAGDWYSSSTEAVNDACDFTGGDLYGDLYNHSFTSKYYMNITKNPPFEYMTCRCANFLSQHTVTKTEEALTLEIMLTCAHHGASFIIDAIDPVGTLDERVYRLIGKIFEKQMGYEKYFIGENVQDVAVYYSTSSRYNREGQSFTNKTASINAVKTLIENHVPAGIISAGCMNKASDYKFIIAPNIINIGENNRNALVGYVRNGGTLYISGAGEPELIKELTGLEYTGSFTKETRTYVSPSGVNGGLFGIFESSHPMPFDFKLPIMENSAGTENTRAYITLPYTIRGDKKFASIHSDPPGIATEIPALVIKKYFAGNVIWSAAPIENDDRIHYKRLLMNLITMFLPKERMSFTSNAGRNVEIVLFRTANGFLFSTVDLKCNEDMIPNMPFDVYISSDKKVLTVKKLPEGINIQFTNKPHGISIRIESLLMFDMYEIITE